MLHQFRKPWPWGLATLCALLLLAPGLAEERELRVLVLSPGYQGELPLRKDRDSIAARFDMVLEADGFEKLLDTLRGLGKRGRIRQLVFLGHGYLGQAGRGGLIDLGQDVDASTLEMNKRLARRKGDSRLLDAFSREAEILYFNCHAGKDPEFLRQTAELFLAFSGGTVYGSDDYVTSELSLWNRALYVLSYLPGFDAEDVDFASPSKVDYRDFQRHALEPFLWRNIEPRPVSIGGPDSVPLNSRRVLEGRVPREWIEGAFRKFVVFRWTEKGRLLGEKPDLTVEFTEAGERRFRLEVLLDNGIGARLLGEAQLNVKVQERQEAPAITPTPSPDPSPEAVAEPRLRGPREVMVSDDFEMVLELPRDLQAKASSFAWEAIGYSGSQRYESERERTSEPRLKQQLGWSDPTAWQVRILDASGKWLATSKPYVLQRILPKFSLTLHGDWEILPPGQSDARSFRLKPTGKVEEEVREPEGFARAHGSLGGAWLAVRWMTEQEMRETRDMAARQSVGAFSGNGRFFRKGKVGFAVESRLEGGFWTNTGGPRGAALAAALDRKWMPAKEAADRQAQANLDATVASIRPSPDGEVTRAPDVPVKQPPTTPPPATPTPTPSPIPSPTPTPSPGPESSPPGPPKPEDRAAPLLEEARRLAAEGRLGEAAERAREAERLDARAAAPVLAEVGSAALLQGWNQHLHRQPEQAVAHLSLAHELLPRDPEARQKLETARRGLANRDRIEPILTRAEALLAERKPPSARKLLLEAEQIENSTPGAQGPRLKAAWEAYNQRNQEYNQALLRWEARNKECFQALDWSGLLAACKEFRAWELTEATERSVAGSEELARGRLAEQEKAWLQIERVRADFEAGRLTQTREAAGVVRRHASVFGAEDPRRRSSQELAALLERVPEVGSAGTAPSGTPSTPTATGVRVPGRTVAGSVYAPNTKGDVFRGGTWANSRGGSDFVQLEFDGVYDVSEIRVAQASTDVTTAGARLLIRLQGPSGSWVVVDDLRETNINRTGPLSGGAIGRSLPPYRKTLSPPVRARVFRLDLSGHGWFGASDIQVIGRRVPGGAPPTTVTSPPKPPAPPSTTPPKPPAPPGTPTSNSVMALLENRSSQNIHVFPQGGNFSPENRILPGQKVQVRVPLPRDGRITFVAGRDGQVLATRRWEGDPEDPRRVPHVVWDGQRLTVSTGLR